MINLLSFTIQSMGVSRQATITSLARNDYVGILAVTKTPGPGTARRKLYADRGLI